MDYHQSGLGPELITALFTSKKKKQTNEMLMLKIIQVKTEATKCTKHKMCATAKTFGHEFNISVCAGQPIKSCLEQRDRETCFRWRIN